MSVSIKKRLMLLEQRKPSKGDGTMTLAIRQPNGVLIKHKTGAVIADADTRQLFILEFIRA